MRFLIPIAAIVFLLEALFVPSGIDTGSNQIASGAKYLWYKQEIRVVNNGALENKAIQQRLPKKASLFDWYVNRRAIEARIERHPFIERAFVNRCSWYSLSCFSLSVRERKPTYLIPVKGVPWIVADDGVFLRPLDNKSDEDKLDLKKLMKVRGIVTKTASPEISRGRLMYLTNAARVIETELGEKLSEIEILPKGEMQVRPASSDYTAHFAYDGKDLSRIGKEAERLRLVVDKLGQKMRMVKEIDLAFKKMAVVRLKTVEKEKTVS